LLGYNAQMVDDIGDCFIDYKEEKDSGVASSNYLITALHKKNRISDLDKLYQKIILGKTIENNGSDIRVNGTVKELRSIISENIADLPYITKKTFLTFFDYSVAPKTSMPERY